MNLTTTRMMYRSDGIFSKVTRDDTGEEVFCTVEHAYLQPDGSYKPILQPGVYNLIFGTHQLEGSIDPATGQPRLLPFSTYEVQDVKDAQGNPHTGILWVHFGNWQTSSKGCSCCGQDFAVASDPLDGMKMDEMVTNSRLTFTKFLDLQNGASSFQLTVIG